MLERIFGPRCRHDWQLLDKTVLPSVIEQMKEAGVSNTKGHGLPGYKVVILTLSCGELVIEKRGNS